MRWVIFVLGGNEDVRIALWVAINQALERDWSEERKKYTINGVKE